MPLTSGVLVSLRASNSISYVRLLYGYYYTKYFRLFLFIEIRGDELDLVTRGKTFQDGKREALCAVELLRIKHRRRLQRAARSQRTLQRNSRLR